MTNEDITTTLSEIKEAQNRVSEEIRALGRPQKDVWDKLGAVAPIVSGLLISTMAGYFTFSYNQQQLHLQEIQTIEKFIPHMLGNEAEKKAAILAMSKLGNTELAARFASLFASEGTVSALKSIATTGNTADRTIANKALEEALENIADHYSVENKYLEAEQAYKEALELKEQTLGADHPDIPRHLDKLSDLYRAHGKPALAETLLRRSLALREKLYGAEDPSLAGTLKSLAEVLRLEGRSAEAEPFLKRALAIDDKTINNRAPGAPGQDGTAAAAADAAGEPKEDNAAQPRDTAAEPAKPQAGEHAESAAAPGGPDM